MSSFKRKVKTTVPTAESAPDSSSALESKVEGLSLQSEAKAQTVFQPVAPITGWKPWVHTGLGVVSSGHRQLDELLGGGVPLGTTTLHVTENYSAFGQTLFAYSLAEGLSHGHENLLLADSGHEAERLLRLLPLNLNLEKVGLCGSDAQAKASEEDKGEDKGEDKSESKANAASGPNWGLKIAWQYEKYLKKDQPKTKSLLSTEKIPFCCSYDLSKRIQEKLLADNLTVQVLDPATESLKDKLDKIIQHVLAFLTEKFAANPQAVCRVYISSFQDVIVAPRSCAQLDEERIALGRFLLRLQRIVRESRVAVFLSVNPTMVPAQSMLSLEQCCDAVLSVDSFAGKAHVVPYEFKEFLGFFTIKKLSQCGLMAPYQPPRGSRFGIKRDRRKLHIEPLHLPPEESRAFGSNCSSQDSAKSEASVSKAFEKIGAVEKSSTPRAVTVDHDHSHAHAHAHSHAHTHPASVNVSQNSSTAVSSGAEVTNTSTPTPKSSLAASLAAARQSRLAAKQQASSEIRPISISKNMPKQTPPSIDF